MESIGRCWQWKAGLLGKPPNNYGIFWDGEAHVLAHRHSLQLKLFRKLSPGMKACHHCDNPQCVRGEHLYEASQGENQTDAYARGRRDGPRQSAIMTKARRAKRVAKAN